MSTIGRRKSTGGFPFPFLAMLLLSASDTVYGRPLCHHGPLCRFGVNAVNKIDTDSEKLYNQFYEESRNVHHRNFKRTVSALDFDNSRIGYETQETDDIVDREDHVTQYLTESLVNTDSEITSLQGSDVEPVEDSNRAPLSAQHSAEDRFFLFLTEEEGILEIDNVLSHPAKSIISESEMVYK